MILGVRHFAVSSISEKLEPKFQKWRRPLTAREAVPYKTKRQKRTAALCVFAFFDSYCGIDSEKGSNAIVSYVENQLRLAEKIPCLFA